MRTQIALTSRASPAIPVGVPVADPSPFPDEPALALFSALFGAHAIERLQVAYLDAAGAVQSLSPPEPGRLDELDLPLRRIVANALARRSAGLLLAHNHPSGDPSPSQGDIVATRRLAEVTHRLDIRVVDHFVISGDRWTSFRALGLL